MAISPILRTVLVGVISPGEDSRRRSTGLGGLIVAVAAAWSSASYCDPGHSLLERITGNQINAVAVKVAELPEKHRIASSDGADFSRDGARVAVGSTDSTISIWDWHSGRVEQILKTPRGYGERLGSPIAYSPDGRFLASCVARAVGDVMVRVWNVQDWSIAHEIVDPGSGGCVAIAFTSGGKSLVRLVSRNVNSGENLISHAVGTWEQEWALQIANLLPSALATSPNGDQIAIGGSLIVFPEGVTDPVAKAQQAKFVAAVSIVDVGRPTVRRVVDCSAADSLAWSADGRRIAAAGGTFVDICDAISGRLISHGTWENAVRSAVLFTGDRRYLIESDTNGKGTGRGVRIWDANRATLLQEIPGDATSIAVSRDSKHLAIGATGSTTVWQLN
jgi:WD40 repeat protein